MLYLLYSNGYLKIGYAKDLQERKKAYNTHNPNYEQFDHTEGYGDKTDEKKLHNQLKDLRHGNSEWFRMSPRIIKVWAEYKKANGDPHTNYECYFENHRFSKYDNFIKIPYDLKEDDLYEYLKNWTEEGQAEIQENYFEVNDKILTANFSKRYINAILNIAKNTKGKDVLYDTIGKYIQTYGKVDNHRLHIFAAMYARNILKIDRHYIGFNNNKYIKFH